MRTVAASEKGFWHNQWWGCRRLFQYQHWNQPLLLLHKCTNKCGRSLSISADCTGLNSPWINWDTPFWAPLNTVEPSAVLASSRDNTDAEIGLPAPLDPARSGGAGRQLAWLEDVGDRGTWATLPLPLFPGGGHGWRNGAPCFKTKPAAVHWSILVYGQVSWVLPVILPALTLIWIVCLCSVTQLCPSLFDPLDCTLPASSVHGLFPGKNTGVGCRALLQGSFLTQGSNLPLLHWQAESLPLVSPGKSNMD